MKTPAYLNVGDTVGILSTARKIKESELQPALDLLSLHGLNALIGHSIGAEDNQYAGDDILRTQDFQAMLDNPNVKAIWCARGGYGTVRILDGLDFKGFQKHPKWIIGYSDITVLHSHLHNLGIESLHAQMPLEIEKKTEATHEGIFKVLFGREYSLLRSEPQPLQRVGAAKGRLIGGNLSVLYSLCGSPTAIDTSGKILFLEDLDEYVYHIDRMIQNLKRNGMLENLVGLVVGGMTQMRDNAIPFGKTAQEIVRDAVREHSFPVCFDFPAGHVKDNRALILGREVSFKVTSEGTTLSF